MAAPARNVEHDFFSLTGGLDLATPAIAKKPGSIISGRNYEPHPKGLARMSGHERFDGRPLPSGATYHVLNFDAGTATIAEGDTVTGATSGATGKALIAMVVSTGTFGGSDAAGYLVLTTVSGTFQDNESLQVTAVTKCVANGTATIRGASNDNDNTTWSRDAIETARALIAAVPGSGPIRGLWAFNSDVYAFRNNLGGSAGVMHKATAAGWVAQSLGSRVRFQTGTAAITAGQTVTGASSGATGVVTRVTLRTGSYGSGNGQGQLIFATITGTFTNGENLQVGGVTKAVANGGSTAITLPAGGKYRFVNHNFFGASNLKRMYGCNSVGTAFEWDGTVFVPIETGMVSDLPTHITVHKGHLFLAFVGGSLQHSSPGEPYAWTAITGASELGIGQDVTDLIPKVGTTLIVFGRNKVSALYGNNVTDWVLDDISDDAGCVQGTAQKIGTPIYLDDIGLRSLETTDKFGDFSLGTITKLVEPLFKSKKSANVYPVASLRVKAKDQYRLYWSDGTILVVYFGRKKPEATICEMGFTPTCVCSTSTDEEDDDGGSEILLAGDEDGMVYRLDSGSSADGEEIIAYVRLAFTHCGRPQQNKVWRRALLEIDTVDRIAIGMSAEFDYGNPETSPMLEEGFNVQAGGGYWDDAVWDRFNWDSAVESSARLGIDGKGKNVSLLIVSRCTYEAPHVIHGMTLFFSPRGMAKK